jgi:hypothetical protein
VTNPSRSVTDLAASLGFALLGQAGPGPAARPLPAVSATAAIAAIAAATATAATATSVRFIANCLRLYARSVTSAQASTHIHPLSSTIR